MKDRSHPSTDIPEAFLNRMAGLLEDEYPPFLSSLQLPANIGLRVNTLKLSPEDFLHFSPFNLSPISWCASGYLLESGGEAANLPPPGKHPYHSAGLYYLQEPSAMAAAEVLSPQPGESVLDLAAAPGGKATHLAALMNNAGVLVANEIHPKRVWNLVENLERCGVTNAVVTNESPEKLAHHFGEYFDRVLLDAPCSGEGMFRKSEIARQEWKPGLVNSCAIRQSAILEQAARMVKRGGNLAYTTCTFSVEENEGVIAGFLAQHPEFDLAPIPIVVGFQPAISAWINLLASNNLGRAIRIWPHHSQGEGHFIALLVKQGSSKLDQAALPGKFLPKPKGPPNSEFPQSARRLLDQFCLSNLDLSFNNSRLILDGSYLYQLPANPPNLQGLKVIRPGWWLGSITKDRFTPSHSLALGMKSTHARFTLALRSEDPELSSFLGGESLSDNGVDGWVLITVDGYPLGWGKRVRNLIKNFYPHGLRRLS